MVMHGKPVETEHAEDSTGRGEEDRHLEGDRNERRPGQVWLAADHERIRDGMHPPLQAEAECGPREAHDQHDPGQRGSPQAHRALEPVYGKGRVGIPPREARVAHPLTRVIEVRRRGEFGEHAVIRALRKLVDERKLERAQ
jgi:hypothetical protein